MHTTTELQPSKAGSHKRPVSPLMCGVNERSQSGWPAPEPVPAPDATGEAPHCGTYGSTLDRFVPASQLQRECRTLHHAHHLTAPRPSPTARLLCHLKRACCISLPTSLLSSAARRTQPATLTGGLNAAGALSFGTVPSMGVASRPSAMHMGSAAWPLRAEPAVVGGWCAQPPAPAANLPLCHVNTGSQRSASQPAIHG